MGSSKKKQTCQDYDSSNCIKHSGLQAKHKVLDKRNKDEIDARYKSRLGCSSIVKSQSLKRIPEKQKNAKYEARLPNFEITYRETPAKENYKENQSYRKSDSNKHEWRNIPQEYFDQRKGQTPG